MVLISESETIIHPKVMWYCGLIPCVQEKASSAFTLPSLSGATKTDSTQWTGMLMDFVIP